MSEVAFSLSQRNAKTLLRYQLQLIRNSHDLMLGTDADGHLLWVNPKTLELTQYNEKELLGQHYLHFVRKDYRSKVSKIFGRQFIRKLDNTYVRFPIVTKTGEERWLGLNVQLVLEDDHPVGFQAVARDITKRKRDERALSHALEESRRRQAEIAALLEGSRAVLKYREFKDAARSILVSCKRLMLAEEGFLLLLPDNQPLKDVPFMDSGGKLHIATGLSTDLISNLNKRLKSLIKAAYENQASGSEWSRLVPDGLERLENILVSPLIIKNKIVGLLCFINKPGKFTQNDARMASAFGELAAVALYNNRTLESLEISEEFFRSVVQTASDAVASADSDEKIIFWNRAAEIIFGYSAREVVGKPITLIMPERFREAHHRGVSKTLSMGTAGDSGKTIEVVGLHRDGHEFPIELSIATWETKDGIFFTAICRDMTERKQAEEALRKAKLAAEIANRAKSVFLANMSHEIRTPLNAIIGMADLLWETPLSAEQQQYVRVFNSAGDTLLSLIDDILDLSKLEDGRQIQLEKIDFDPSELVEKTCEIMAHRAHEKGLELAYHVSSDVPARLIGDPHRLRQILINLIGNAIKFTEDGEVVVRVSAPSPENSEACQITGYEAQSQLLFSVTDTGMGIPHDKLSDIFDSFAQADSSTTRQHGGTGLGLTICRHLVGLMDGEIWVDSQPGVGSTFFFTVRLALKKKLCTAADAPVSDDLQGLKALVLDDNATTRTILSEWLESWGAQVTEAETVDQALCELKRARASAESYYLLLLDSRMPGTGGFQLVESMRDDPKLADIVIMMMLTCDHRRNDINRSRELGISACLVKPIKSSSLLAAIQSARGDHNMVYAESGIPAPEKDAGKVRLPALRILLVEDSDENCMLIRAFLSKTPYELDIAENGERGVEMFTQGTYDLVLMDLQMPILDGYAATRAIRDWESQKGKAPVPVIALTAYALQEDIQRSLEAGCTFHLSKPIKRGVLLDIIDRFATKEHPATNKLDDALGP